MLLVLKMLMGIIPNMIGKFADSRKNKRELANAIAVKKLDHVREKDMADTNWEMEQVKASQSSWKDEFWTLIFGYLLLSPVWAPQQMKLVFESYKSAPEWFQLCVLVSVGASFGVKIWKMWKA